MAQTLRCDCGYQVQLDGEEAQELTWCPHCRKVLHQPKEYAVGQRTYTKSGVRPVTRGTSGPAAGGRIAGIIGMAIAMAVARGACQSASHYDSPTYYNPPPITVPQVDFDPPRWQDFPQQDPLRPAWPPGLPNDDDPVKRFPGLEDPPKPFLPDMERPDNDRPDEEQRDLERDNDR